MRTAQKMLDAMGLEAFAERAPAWVGRHRREGAQAHHRYGGHAHRAEAYTARLASQGHTNAEVGAQLCLSMRTVEWHLS